MLNQFVKSVLIKSIRFYQAALAPLHRQVCRFWPSCSEYFIEALEKKGLVKGLYQGIKRLLRCHPLGGKGFDPVD